MFIPRRYIYTATFGIVLLTIMVLRGVAFNVSVIPSTSWIVEASEPIEIYVAGQGKLKGLKAAGMGFVVQSLEKIPVEGGELLQIGLIVINTTQTKKPLDFGVAVVSRDGVTVELDQEVQTPVVVEPGELSPGIIEIEVPYVNREWELELSGGCLGTTVRLPLVIQQGNKSATE